jgi:hypothetical protein
MFRLGPRPGVQELPLNSGVATERAQIYADPNQVKHEVWAGLRRRCAHFDRAKLTPVHRFVTHGGLPRWADRAASSGEKAPRADPNCPYFEQKTKVYEALGLGCLALLSRAIHPE